MSLARAAARPLPYWGGLEWPVVPPPAAMPMAFAMPVGPMPFAPAVPIAVPMPAAPAVPIAGPPVGAPSEGRTWSWVAIQTQRLSVKLHKAVAFEINNELGYSIGSFY